MDPFSDGNPTGVPINVRDQSTGGTHQMEFIGQTMNKRRLIRQPKNPMDKCTIVSIFPKDVDEIKHTIEPGKFHIPAGSIEKPGLLVVGTSSWWKDVDVEQPMIEIPVGSVQIADSIVKDWANSMLASNMGDAMPGMFWVTGEHPLSSILKNYQRSLREANEKQMNWYKLLVRLADSLWARSNGNPLVIADDMRLAAKSLGVDKPWLKDYVLSENVRCAYCGSIKNANYPICPTCRAIDQTHPLAKDVKFAV